MRDPLWPTLAHLIPPSAALAAATLLLIGLTATMMWLARRRREAIPLPEYIIVHTLWGRLKNVAWTVVAAVAALLVTHWLTANRFPDRMLELLSSLLPETLRPLALF